MKDKSLVILLFFWSHTKKKSKNLLNFVFLLFFLISRPQKNHFIFNKIHLAFWQSNKGWSNPGIFIGGSGSHLLVSLLVQSVSLAM